MSITFGFTGTRQGMSLRQQTALDLILGNMGPFLLHHGDCVGADEEAQLTALRYHNPDDECPYITVHPPERKMLSANTNESQYIQVLGAKPYLHRNRDIVAASDILIAAPLEMKESVIGGTWFTIRYAREMNIPVIMLDR